MIICDIENQIVISVQRLDLLHSEKHCIVSKKIINEHLFTVLFGIFIHWLLDMLKNQYKWITIKA